MRRSAQHQSDSPLKRRKVRRYQDDNQDDEDRIMPDHPSQDAPPFQIDFTSHANGQNGVHHQNGYGQEDVQMDNMEEEEEEEDEEEEEGESMTAQELEQAREELRGKGFSIAGILESVQLDRFMSHLCFEYKLGRNLNIVNGPNGSGKSAIVAALQIGLGARASATERGSKLEDHIMHGKDSAIITIRIHNERPQNTGENKDKVHDSSYKYEKYGNKIIIERRLMRKGGGGFEVKDYKGKRVKFEDGETARSEVRNIVDHFSFMVDNPVAILTQTKSKAFLAKCRPTEHYNLYREATLLGPLEEELVGVLNVVNGLTKDLERKKKDMPKSEKKLRRLERAHEEAQMMKNIDERIQEKETLWAWTLHEEAENQLQRMETVLEEDYGPVAKKAEEEYKEARTVVQGLDDEIKQLNNAAGEQQALRDDCIRAVREAKRIVKSKLFDIQRHRSKANEAQNDVEDNKRKEIQLENTLKQRRLEHLESQNQKDEMTRQLEGAESRVGELEQVELEKKKLVQEAQMKNRSDKEKIPREEEDLRRIEDDFAAKRNNQMRIQGMDQGARSLARFDRGYGELLHRIRERERDFSIPPVGPLGLYIKVRDQDWAKTVDACLGKGTLHSFIVNNGRDASILKGILRNLQLRPSILVRDLTKDRYQIGDNNKPTNIRAAGRMRCLLLDMLVFDHPAVFNAIVDMNSIERIVLVGKKQNGDMEDVTELGWDRNTQNILAVWNQAGEHAYNRNGSNTFRKSPYDFGQRAPICCMDQSSYIRALDDEIRMLEQKRNDQIEKLRHFKRIERDSNQDLFAAIDTATKVGRDLAAAKNERLRLEDVLNQAATMFDAEPYEREIEQVKKQMEDDEKSAAAELKWIEEGEASIADLKVSEKKAVDRMQELDVEYRVRTEKVERKNEQLSVARSNMHAKKMHHQKADQRWKAGQEEANVVRADVMKRLTNAQQFGERPQKDKIDVKKNPSGKLQRDLNILKNRSIAEQEKRGGRSARDIENEFRKAQKKVQETIGLLNRIEKYHEQLQFGIRLRKKKRVDLDRQLRRHTRNHFNKFLGVRGHSGALKFGRNDKNQYELVITTEMASHAKADGERFETADLRSLSGGERSFTTLAFMLALAEVCNNPVRVMDEIDVFQDEANRRASFRTLIDYCSTYLADKQFIIITPLHLPDVNPSDNVRIVKLAAPIRRSIGTAEQTAMDQYM